VAIPEDQLTTWAKIGAQTTSKDTYAAVKLALEYKDAGYHDKNYQVFLQGSYGNDTNIRKESDVDVVIQLDSIFTYDIESLPADQQTTFRQSHGPSAYTQSVYRQHVLDVLYERFGTDVEPGTKAVKIAANGNRRNSDVLIAIQHRRYSQYTGDDNANQVTGISFQKSDGTRVVNYPKKHKANMIAKNQNTNEWFKHIVRIYKNARQRMIADGLIKEGGAPSYYIEGLLYNVPDNQFGTSYENSMVNTINWLAKADQSKLACANMQYWLLRGPADVTWNSADCTAFIDGLIELWNNW
jgi:hypothetical protein